MRSCSLVVLSLTLIGALAAPVAANPEIDRKPGDSTLYQIVSTTPGFEVLTQALEISGFDQLADSRMLRITVFAPTNDAFERVADELGFQDIDALVAFLVDNDLLDDVLVYHVLPGRRFSNSVLKQKGNKKLVTLLGQRLYASPAGTLIDQSEMTSDAAITSANLVASNGVAHVIDNVLVPVLGD